MENLDLMSSFEKKLDFLSSHHICTQVAVLLQILLKKKKDTAVPQGNDGIF